MGEVSLPVLGPDPFSVTAAVLNGKVDPLATEFNGSIENVNIKAGASIASSKLNLATIAQSMAMSSKQLLEAKGADVASGTSITLGTDGNVFDITGTTNIETIAIKQAGSSVKLQFDGALTLVDDTGNLELNGANISVSAEDVVVLVSDGTNWLYAGGSVAVSDTEDNPRALDVVTTEATIINNTTSKETLYSFSIPANTLGTSNMVRFKVGFIENNGSSSDMVTTYRLEYGTTVLTSVTCEHGEANDTSWASSIEGLIKAGDTSGVSANTQTGQLQLVYSTVDSGDAAAAIRINGGTAAEDSTGALEIKVTAQCSVADGNISVVKKYATLELLPAL